MPLAPYLLAGVPRCQSPQSLQLLTQLQAQQRQRCCRHLLLLRVLPRAQQMALLLMMLLLACWLLWVLQVQLALLPHLLRLQERLQEQRLQEQL